MEMRADLVNGTTMDARIVPPVADREQQKNQRIAERLEITRLALGYKTQTAFVADLATELDVSVQRWNAFECARKRITPDVALAVMAKWDVSLDWIYAGKRTGLPHGLVKAIEEVEWRRR